MLECASFYKKYIIKNMNYANRKLSENKDGCYGNVINFQDELLGTFYENSFMVQFSTQILVFFIFSNHAVLKRVNINQQGVKITEKDILFYSSFGPFFLFFFHFANVYEIRFIHEINDRFQQVIQKQNILNFFTNWYGFSKD